MAVRYAFSAALVVGALALQARAVITVKTTVALNEGVRLQAVIEEQKALQGEPTFARFIKEVHAAMLIRDGSISNGVQLTKRQLTASQAYGQGLPFGYENPPTTDPEGPWFGLVWPYRDQYDYFPDPFDPLGNAVGTFFQSQPGVYGFVDIDGIARGGPTDPEPAGGSPNLLTRGVTGNGLDPELPQPGPNPGPATYFAFDLIPLLGPFDRTVILEVFAASAVIVQQEGTQGPYSEIVVQIPDFQMLIQLPEPTTALAGSALLGLLAARPRRR
jgi:hypothetical protein